MSKAGAAYTDLLFDGQHVLAHYKMGDDLQGGNPSGLRRLAVFADDLEVGAIATDFGYVEPDKVAVTALNENAEAILGATELTLSVDEWKARTRCAWEGGGTNG